MFCCMLLNVRSSIEVSKGANIRNRYNQVSHLTQDTNGKVTNLQQTPQTRAKRLALSQVTTKHKKADAHKDIANTRQNKNIKEIILIGKRELVALLNLSSWCLVMVERLFLAVPWDCLRFVIVVFPDHTYSLFWQP